MKLAVAAFGFAICAAALLAETPAQTPPLTADASEDNPGYIDDPTAKALVLAELADNDINVKDVTIVYTGTTEGKSGGVNFYRVTNVKTGKVWRVAVAVSFEESTADANI
jgi:hypothetical protein